MIPKRLQTLTFLGLHFQQTQYFCTVDNLTFVQIVHLLGFITTYIPTLPYQQQMSKGLLWSLKLDYRYLGPRSNPYHIPRTNPITACQMYFNAIWFLHVNQFSIHTGILAPILQVLCSATSGVGLDWMPSYNRPNSLNHCQLLCISSKDTHGLIKHNFLFINPCWLCSIIYYNFLSALDITYFILDSGNFPSTNVRPTIWFVAPCFLSYTMGSHYLLHSYCRNHFRNLSKFGRW